MKKQVYTLIALFVLVSSVVLAAQAQSLGGVQLIATIPFEFTVGNKTLPAGEYKVVQMNPGSDHAVLQFRNRTGSASVLVQMTAVIGKAETAKLIFNRYGDKYFFGQAWVDGNQNGLQAPKPQAERIIERDLAGTKARRESVAINARR